MTELKDILNENFKNEIDGVMFAVFKFSSDNTISELKEETSNNRKLLLMLTGNNDNGIYDMFNEETQSYYDVDDMRFIANRFNYKIAPILTDVFVFQKDKHDLEYFKKMANQLDDINNLPIKRLIFRPIFDKFSKTLNDRLLFQVTNDCN